MPHKLKDAMITILCLSASSLICAALVHFSANDAYACMIFVLGVAFVAKLTDGWIWGTVASLAATILVNWAFTEPFLTFKLNIAGYPLTFVTMLVVSLIISMQTTQIKKQAEIRSAAEHSKLRSELLRAISHDMRTPLTGISTAASALLDVGGKLPEQTSLKLISDIKRESDWLTRAFGNILTLTRLDSGEAGKAMRDEAAEEVVAEAVSQLRQRYRDIRIITEVPTDYIVVSVEHLLIEQVIMNLAENAVTHGKNTTAVEVGVRAENGFAVFSVSDNGGGVPPELAPHLFDGYFATRAQTGDQKRGLGLGLALCSSIVKLHGGTIRQYNNDIGAVFEFMIPMKKEG